jgi:arylsulfatase A-like enzyme
MRCCPFTRSALFALCALLSLLLALGCASKQPTAAAAVRKPLNIVYIVSDDHAAHALSCYGSAINRTPNLDALASQGIRLDRAFVTNSLCGPSRACILTGKYSHVHGFMENDKKFDGSQWNFAKELQHNGYSTAWIGKWHLESEPQGFDWHDILPGHGVYVDSPFLVMGKRTPSKGYVTDVITDKALSWLDRAPKDKPFCLVVGHKAPHRTWIPDEEHRTQFADRTIPEAATLLDDYATRSPAAAEASMRVSRDLSKDDVKGEPPASLEGDAKTRWYYQRYMQDYLACVQSLDDNVGRLLAWLDAHGHRDDTLIVYTSDNGFFLGDHGWYDKRFAYEESLRVPMLIRWPGVTTAGSHSDAMALNIDLAATALDAAGLTTNEPVQGKSLRPIAAGTTPADWRQSIYYHYYEYPGPHHVQPHVAVRTATHKLIWFPKIEAFELFDLVHDPRELRNLAGAPEAAAVERDLRAQLEALRQQFGDNTVGAVPPK